MVKKLNKKLRMRPSKCNTGSASPTPHDVAGQKRRAMEAKQICGPHAKL